MKVQVYDCQILQNKNELWEKITAVAATINKKAFQSKVIIFLINKRIFRCHRKTWR